MPQLSPTYFFMSNSPSEPILLHEPTLCLLGINLKSFSQSVQANTLIPEEGFIDTDFRAVCLLHKYFGEDIKYMQIISCGNIIFMFIVWIRSAFHLFISALFVWCLNLVLCGIECMVNKKDSTLITWIYSPIFFYPPHLTLDIRLSYIDQLSDASNIN